MGGIVLEASYLAISLVASMSSRYLLYTGAITQKRMTLRTMLFPLDSRSLGNELAGYQGPFTIVDMYPIRSRWEAFKARVLIYIILSHAINDHGCATQRCAMNCYGTTVVSHCATLLLESDILEIHNFGENNCHFDTIEENTTLRHNYRI